MTHVSALVGGLAVAGAMLFGAPPHQVESRQPPRPAAPAVSPQQPPGATTPLTISGCLTKWEAATADPRAPTASPSRPAGTGGQPPRFVLVSRDRAPAQAGTPAPAGEAATAGARYILSAGTGIDLAAHVDHEVRVEGTLEPSGAVQEPPAMGRSRDQQRDTEAGMAGAGPAGSWPTLRARSLTMVSARCPSTR